MSGVVWRSIQFVRAESPMFDCFLDQKYKIVQKLVKMQPFSEPLYQRLWFLYHHETLQNFRKHKLRSIQKDCSILKTMFNDPHSHCSFTSSYPARKEIIFLSFIYVSSSCRIHHKYIQLFFNSSSAASIHPPVWRKYNYLFLKNNKKSDRWWSAIL